jgi:putative membrane protein
MSFIILICKGFLIGLAFIIPGLSGGTVAMYLGVYEKLVHAIGKIFKEFRQSLAFLVPLFLGIAISVIGLAALIGLLLSWNSWLVLMLFIGLLLGGLPHLVREMGAKPFLPSMIIAALLSFIAVVGLVIGAHLYQGNQTVFPIGFGSFVWIFLLGMISSMRMSVPGISGSALLMTLGVYTAIVTNVIGNVFDFSVIGYNLFVLVPFALGIAVGIISFSNLIERIMKRHPRQFYAAVIGFITASVIAIFLEIRDPLTGASYSDQLPIYHHFWDYVRTHPLVIALGVVLLIGGYVLVHYLFHRKQLHE